MSIRLRGRKFQVRITVNGRTVTQSFDNRLEAQRWELEQKILLDQGIVERHKPAPASARFTLTEAIARYSKEILPCKRGQQSEQYLLKYWQGSALAKVQVSTISGKDLVEERDKLLRAALAPASVRRYLDCLSSVPVGLVERSGRGEWLFASGNRVRRNVGDNGSIHVRPGCL